MASPHVPLGTTVSAAFSRPLNVIKNVDIDKQEQFLFKGIIFCDGNSVVFVIFIEPLDYKRTDMKKEFFESVSRNDAMVI